MDITDEDKRDAPSMIWIQDPTNVNALGRWLFDNVYIDKAEDLLDYFEKPWKWTTEYNLMIVEQKRLRDLPGGASDKNGG